MLRVPADSYNIFHIQNLISINEIWLPTFGTPEFVVVGISSSK